MDRNLPRQSEISAVRLPTRFYTACPTTQRSATGGTRPEPVVPFCTANVWLRKMRSISVTYYPIRCCALGVRAACLPLSLVSGDVASGRLVVWGDVVGAEAVLWALYPSRRLLSARVSAFLAYLKTAFPTGTPKELAAHLLG